MNLGLRLFIFMQAWVLITTPEFSFAEDYRRKVDLEWEAIDQAKAYDLEIQKIGSDKAFPFQTVNPKWTGHLTPGTYTMRLRSRDLRQVPGPWSPLEEFKVELDPVVLKNPRVDQVFKTEETEMKTVNFEWEKHPGAAQYHFQLYDENNEKVYESKISETQLPLSISVARKYKWRVTAIDARGEVGQTGEVPREFTLWGAELDSPVVEMPVTEFVRDLRWKIPAHTQYVEVQVLKHDPRTNRYLPVQILKDFTETSIPFQPDWSGGTYRVKVKASSKFRPDSNFSGVEFPVRAGDRSPASEFRSTIRQSIERVEGWYAVASYMASQLQYSAVDRASNNSYANRVFGGTARLGLGYFQPEKTWGFLAASELGGFNSRGVNYNNSAMEVNAVKRYDVTDRSEIRASIGLFHKELPQVVENGSGYFQKTDVTSEGPQSGIELWYSATDKLGFQMNAKGALAVNGRNPSNGALIPTVSTQFGILGSYKFFPTLTGLMGMTFRHDQIQYRPDQQGNGGSQAREDSYNEVDLKGTYLNMHLEYDF